MAIIITPPPYPVINSNPDFKAVVRNFKRNEYERMGFFTLISIPLGYFAGTSNLPQMRVPSAVLATVIGATGSFCLAYQASTLRLIGLRPNDEDVNAAKRS
ncbi:hypothetical protein GUITHDRAFT_146584 [Guillardia theta CCMP2712]|uniref:NADH-ubiquinone oxidoreductase 21kDa subunit N-terminal domain-containing protein n=1 Tax=Guillardia theta (strain CCMP2712) TaxID=905079 RepID=L1IHA3_GUITC|nr:hypothetical protein GUITHDRAFT_146584 [Guillardia theta CCMP2712]EKX35274.1 hypothetical protein GUITHDRAFT_146584 [Guillardia theta CCMP2712]|mmetsp:Transcript_22670/g.74175  ORF Transcript_22670/g.74175 Transcript_22670/m.74175 type:complete len:101 (+) Transcript_22670:93-395(+)|eukprot:XP_005822254.1 hypothetical protein GUITHDRAFT_146584 [Guillardia theta CCMP2712]